MFSSRRKASKYHLLIFLGFVFLFFIYRIYKKNHVIQYPGDQINRDFEKYMTYYENNYWKKTESKKVLFWTPFFGGWSWYEDAVKILPTCPDKCTASKDQSEVQSADAILFHANDLWKHRGLIATIYNPSVGLPEWRSPNQIWGMYSWEPLMYMWGNTKPNTFNWTLLYRRESTIYMPFTGYYKLSDEELKNNPNKKEDRNYFKEKTKFASTMVSNCVDQAGRYKFLHELNNYIDLDNFGKCSGKYVCPAGVPTTECGKKHLAIYKFYLAFENSYCRDYVSEKFWNALDRRQIPVIAAPKYNLELLPPNSYLNVFDFPTIKDLADRMIEIGSNEELYNSYFEWTKYWRLNGTSVYCKLCRELHANRRAQSYADFEGWLRDDICYKSNVS